MSAEMSPEDSGENDLSLVTSSGVRVAIEAATGNIGGGVPLDPDDLYGSVSVLMEPAYEGSLITIDQINANSRKKRLVKVPSLRNLEDEFIEWFDKPRRDHTAEKVRQDPDSRWYLGAVPNVSVTRAQFLGCAVIFGEDQPKPSDISSNIIDVYSPEEISGTNPSNGKAFKFKLFKAGLTLEDFNLPKLKSIRDRNNPYVEGASPLEGINLINTLRAANNGELVNPEVEETTYLSSLGLKPKYSVDGLFVPSLHVEPSGALVISSSQIFAHQAVGAVFKLKNRQNIA
jgi:hypothetical protein